MNKKSLNQNQALNAIYHREPAKPHTSLQTISGLRLYNEYRKWT